MDEEVGDSRSHGPARECSIWAAHWTASDRASVRRRASMATGPNGAECSRRPELLRPRPRLELPGDPKSRRQSEPFQISSGRTVLAAVPRRGRSGEIHF